MDTLISLIGNLPSEPSLGEIITYTFKFIILYEILTFIVDFILSFNKTIPKL